MADRALSNVVGFILVFSLVVTSVSVITVFGLDTLQTVRDAEQADNAQRAFEVLAENMADIHRRDAPSRATEMDLKNARLYVADPVTITVTVENTTSGRTEQFQQQSDPLVFDPGGPTEIYYEAGALFRVRRDGGTVVRDPPFVIDDNRLLVPVLNLTAGGTTSVGGSTVLVRANQNDETIGTANTTGGWDEMNLTVESPRHDHWETYLSEKSAVSSCSTLNSDAVECTIDGADKVYVTTVQVGVEIEQ